MGKGGERDVDRAGIGKGWDGRRDVSSCSTSKIRWELSCVIPKMTIATEAQMSLLWMRLFGTKMETVTAMVPIFHGCSNVLNQVVLWLILETATTMKH